MSRSTTKRAGTSPHGACVWTPGRWLPAQWLLGQVYGLTRKFQINSSAIQPHRHTCWEHCCTRESLRKCDFTLLHLAAPSAQNRVFSRLCDHRGRSSRAAPPPALVPALPPVCVVRGPPSRSCSLHAHNRARGRESRDFATRSRNSRLYSRRAPPPAPRRPPPCCPRCLRST